MEITKMLTLSTAHITKNTCKRLETDPDDNNLGLSVYKKADYGFFIYLPAKDEKLPSHYNSLPEDLYMCLFFAHELGCEILCFDCDGPIESCLQTYEW